MAIVVMILGESGTGKSASLRKFKPQDVAIVNVIGKPLPFRSRGFDTLNSDNYGEIRNYISSTDKKSIVIDDAQYLMANEFMRRAREKGYEKFTEIGQAFWDLINYCRKLPDDVIVYFLQHTETGADGSTVKAKTIGKMLDEKVTLEGMFSIVLRTNVNEGVYSFTTQNCGTDTVKSPVGMFESDLIPNDLKAVDDHIREYYDLKPQEFDMHAPTDDIVEYQSEPAHETNYMKLRGLLDKYVATEEELRSVVADKGIYPVSTHLADYEDDFQEFLCANFNKIYAAIVAKRDPLG